MNKKIVFTQLGGFPVTQYTFNYMQDSYRNCLSGIASLIGDKAILSGVVEAGGNVSDGWVSINGELLPFIGGPLAAGAQVVIVETKEARLFGDNSNYDVYIKREARLGAPGLFPFADLKRPEVIKNVWQKNDIKMVACDMAYLAANFENGIGKNDRAGWLLCNGLNGTIDMGGRLAIGYDATKDDYDELLAAVGADTVTLTIENMPRHNHTGNTVAGGNVDPGEYGLVRRGQNGQNTSPGALDGTNAGNEPQMNIPPVDIPYQGDSAPFNIVPPAVVVLFIQKA